MEIMLLSNIIKIIASFQISSLHIGYLENIVSNNMFPEQNYFGISYKYYLENIHWKQVLDINKFQLNHSIETKERCWSSNHKTNPFLPVLVQIIWK